MSCNNRSAIARCQTLQFRGARALLVEANEIRCLAAAELLTSHGIAVETAQSADGAIARLPSGEQFDIVFVDLEMAAWSATRAVREAPGGADVPIVAMMEHGTLGDRERCLEAGMDDFLYTPFGSIALWECLLRWLGRFAFEGGVTDASADECGEQISALRALQERLASFFP